MKHIGYLVKAEGKPHMSGLSRAEFTIYDNPHDAHAHKIHLNQTYHNATVVMVEIEEKSERGEW